MLCRRRLEGGDAMDTNDIRYGVCVMCVAMVVMLAAGRRQRVGWRDNGVPFRSMDYTEVEQQPNSYSCGCIE